MQIRARMVPLVKTEPALSIVNVSKSMTDRYVNQVIEIFHNSRLIRRIQQLTRLHSSRMRTARLLTISPSMLCSGGVPASGGGVSQHALRQTTPCGQNSWHTLLKILPCLNFVAGGNEFSESFRGSSIIVCIFTACSSASKTFTPSSNWTAGKQPSYYRDLDFTNCVTFQRGVAFQTGLVSSSSLNMLKVHLW